MEPLRYQDKGIFLMHFADQIAVLCPKCHQAAEVQASWEPYQWSGKVFCSQCTFVANLDADHWYGSVTHQGRVPCGHCGHKWLSVSKRRDNNQSPKINTHAAYPQTCPECQHITPVPIQYTSRCREDAVDPHFGLPLRLTTQTRLGAVWVYNLRHLAELKAYISAELREGVTFNRAMFSRLPRWMKMAKNRGVVLHALELLQKQSLK